MSSPSAFVSLTPEFLARVESTGLSDAALAAAIGVTPQYYSQVKSGHVAPSVRFIAGAVVAGLADSFAGVVRRFSGGAR